MKTRIEARELEQEAIDKGYMKRKNSKAMAREAVDYVMEKYPITMEKLRLEEEREAKAKRVYDEVMQKYPNLMEKLRLEEQKAISKSYGKN